MLGLYEIAIEICWQMQLFMSESAELSEEVVVANSPALIDYLKEEEPIVIEERVLYSET